MFLKIIIEIKKIKLKIIIFYTVSVMDEPHHAKKVSLGIFRR